MGPNARTVGKAQGSQANLNLITESSQRVGKQRWSE
jgi:hypothetical protein